MTSKVLKIFIGNEQIFINRKDLKGIDLSQLRITTNGYVAVGKKYLHRLILNPPVNMQVDHKNRNKLDNRRQNLRICTVSQNGMNREKQRNNRSGFKGVDANRRCKKGSYRARITANKKVFYLGSFKNPDEAGEAYKKAARQYHGEFANFSGKRE